MSFCNFENGVEYCVITGYTTSNSNCLQNIIVLNGTKGVIGSLLDLSGLTVGVDYHQACGFNSDGVYTVKNLLDDESIEFKGENYIYVSGDTIGTTLHGGNGITIDSDGSINVPTEQHKLLYSYNNKTLTPKFLMEEDIYVVDSVNHPEDLTKCMGVKPNTININEEWQQYSDSNFSPEYFKGYTNYRDNHKSSKSDFGYGYWNSTTDYLIKNPNNTQDFCGFINPIKSNKFSYTSIIGSNIGKITGGSGGFSLINDSHAIPRHIICDDGNTYYRNTLYDLTDSSGKRNSDLKDNQGYYLWCAWVCEDKGNNAAYVIYTKQIDGSGKFSGGYVDNVPEVGESVKIYKVNGVKTKEERTTYTEYDSTTVTQFNESSGYIVTLNILTLNSKWLGYLKNSSTSTTGTIVIFTNVFPTNSTNISSGNVSDYFVVNYDGRCFIVEDGSTSKNDGKLYGCDLVKFNENLDLNSATGYSFIRSNIDFNNGVLTLQFSNVNGKKGVGVTMPSDYLDNNNLERNLPLNGSKLVINFNNGTVDLTPYAANTNTTITTKISDLNALTNANAKYDLNGNYNTGGDEINVFNSFKGEVKFMYIAQSMANLMYKCNGFTYEERVIIDVNEGKNEVYTYNPVIGDYAKVTDKTPFDYFTGSHISYNDITEKLWYSNGTKITQIATNCDCSEGGNDEIIIQDSDVVSVIIPEYEDENEPDNPTLGEYWFNTSDEILYVYTYNKDDDVYEFKIANTDDKFINKDKTYLYKYNDEVDKWTKDKGYSTKIYITKNTNEMLLWSESLQKFVSFVNNSDVLNDAIHFTEVGEVYTETNIPQASSVTFEYILVENSDGYFTLHEKYLKSGRFRVFGWRKIVNPDIVIQIYSDDTERIFQKIEYNGDFVYEEISTDNFIQNVYYINDNNGDVYAWNGIDLIKLSNDELLNILPENVTFVINFNSSHNTNQKMFITPNSNNAISEDTDISSYQADGNHTVIAINSETDKKTIFDLKVYHDDKYIYQKLYNNDVVYTRKKTDSGNWSNWNAVFTKTNLCLDIQQESILTQMSEVITKDVKAGTYDNTVIFENDKEFKIKIKSSDDEFIKINESFLSIRFYRKYNRHNVNKWRFIGKRVLHDKSVEPIIVTSNGDEFEEMSFILSECNRGVNSPFYVLPFTLKELMNGLIKCYGSVQFNGEMVSINNLNDIMKFGCNNEKCNANAYKNVTRMEFTTYGYDKQFRVNEDVLSNPSISIIVGINLVFGVNTNGVNYDCTEIIPYRGRVRYEAGYYLGKPNYGIVYNLNNILTKSISPY
jgi:hypothetical protein